MTEGLDVADPIEAEIAQLRAEVKEREERIRHLRRLRSFPTVMPELVVWRHHTRYLDDLFAPEYEDDPLYAAYQACSVDLEEGLGSPEGVSVGGFLYTMDDLERRFHKSRDEVVA